MNAMDAKNDGKRNIHFEPQYRLDRLFSFNPKFMSVGIQRGDENGYDYFSHIQTEYEFIYMLDGDISFYCDDVRMYAHTGDMYFIQPGQRHRKLSGSPFVKFVYLKFFLYDYKGEREDKLTEKREMQLFKAVPEKIKHAFLRVFEEMQASEWGFKQIIESAITEILIFVQRQYRTKDDSIQCDSSGVAISAIMDEIALNVGNSYSVSSLAKKYNMSESSLSHSFKRVIGKPLMRYINERRMQEAEFQLSATSNTLKYIAKQLGYGSVSYFKRVFKQYTGFPPDEYRRRILGVYKEKGEREDNHD